MKTLISLKYQRIKCSFREILSRTYFLIRFYLSLSLSLSIFLFTDSFSSYISPKEKKLCRAIPFFDYETFSISHLNFGVS